ncbi:phage major capsid protein [Xanthobacter sp. TB0139]|uniref:phage major capsid protein n=1 Tax=Xanthobacter sp. TB0139 TaxID=3459178 RepID=UPI0040395B52
MHNINIAGAAALATLAHACPPRALLGTPRAETGSPRAAVEAMNRAFEEFKAANDERLSGKANGPEVDEKLGKINAAMDNIQTELDRLARENAARAASGGGQDRPAPEDPEYSQAWAKFFRDGQGEAQIRAASKAGPRADLSVGVAEGGGYLAPVEWDRTITNRLQIFSPMRAHASSITVSKAGFTKLYNEGGADSGWVAETAARPATGTPTVKPLTFETGEMYAYPHTTQTLLEDAEIDVEAWLAAEVQDEFAKQEGAAFLAGDGAGKPFGVLTYVDGEANAARHPYGAIGTVETAASGALGADDLINLIYDLPAELRAGAKLFLNRASLRECRKLKDGDGNYLWQPAFAAGQPSTLLGEAVVEMPGMPDIAAEALPVLYGDMAATYLIVDRLGISVLRDELTRKPYVGFYTRKRVGGGVVNPEPMRALKIKA